MIKEITKEKITGYRSYVIFTTNKSKDIFFEIQGNKLPAILEKFDNSLGNYVDQYVKQKSYPNGIFNVETVVENKIFRITYSESEISKDKVAQFAESLNL
jgi:hypothetical protein